MLGRALPLVLVASLSSPVMAQQSIPDTTPPDLFGRQSTYTVLVPLSVMNIDRRSISGQTILSVDLAGSDAEALLPNGTFDWRVSGFPAEQEVRFHALRRDNRRKTVEVEYRNKAFYFKFRYPMGIDGNVALRPFVSPGGLDSPITRDRISAQVDVLADFVFSGKLTGIPAEARQPLLQLAKRTAGGIGVSAVDYRDQTFFTVDIGGDNLVYNTLQVNQSARVSKVVADRALVLLKAFAPPVKAASGLDGVALKLEVLSQDFLAKGAYEEETVMIYAPSLAIASFAADDITSQEFINQCFVIVDGNRVSVDLSLQ